MSLKQNHLRRDAKALASNLADLVLPSDEGVIGVVNAIPPTNAKVSRRGFLATTAGLGLLLAKGCKRGGSGGSSYEKERAGGLILQTDKSYDVDRLVALVNDRYNPKREVLSFFDEDVVALINRLWEGIYGGRLPERILAKPARSGAFYYPSDVALIPDNISVGSLIDDYIHEVLGHGGLKLFDETDGMFGQIYGHLQTLLQHELTERTGHALARGAFYRATLAGDLVEGTIRESELKYALGIVTSMLAIIDAQGDLQVALGKIAGREINQDYAMQWASQYRATSNWSKYWGDLESQAKQLIWSFNQNLSDPSLRYPASSESIFN